jgi:hypothetical protein
MHSPLPPLARSRRRALELLAACAEGCTEASIAARRWLIRRGT